ncbi:hypothetical protein NW766_012485 [Fusarium irregulare]|uniref:Uncharacterized protein n=1 Tax=Fusarium irregulare TaxID=2494466 RepID=A0A9W8PDQ0_9HYPO|nr:hypothetical protein NW766_012485 [Fusarium irregulare]
MESDSNSHVDNGPFNAPAPEHEPEQIRWPEGLGSFDVFSLIVNKMIGTGIYTSPAVVYRMTGSKSITLALFGLDEITASETPTAIPTSTNEAPQQEGTELQDLPHTQQIPVPSSSGPQPAPWYRKLLGDGLLAYIIYSLTFVIFFNSATNGQQFGRMILLYNHADADDIDAEVRKDDHLMRYIAVTVLSIICIIQFFSAKFGRRLNRFLAVVKIGFLIGLVGVGLSALARDFYKDSKDPPSRAEDWSVRHEVKSKVSFAKALLVVLFSFEGWENATFVSLPPFEVLW